MKIGKPKEKGGDYNGALKSDRAIIGKVKIVHLQLSVII